MFLKQLLTAVSFINLGKKFAVFQIVYRFLKPNLKKTLDECIKNVSKEGVKELLYVNNLVLLGDSW